jgi:L-threonylcarbamoyladenylate synthase
MNVFSSLADPELITLIKNGAIGVLPTDTVYGVVARAADKTAVARLYQLKSRDHKPGTVVAASVEQLLELGVPQSHMQKVQHLWPNPISVETPLGDNLAYSHQDTGRQAFRVVAEPNLRALLEQTGPLVTSSANQPGEPTSVTVQEAKDYFGDQVDFYVDGGDLSGRPSSTLVKVSDEGIEVIRQGIVTINEKGEIV